MLFHVFQRRTWKRHKVLSVKATLHPRDSGRDGGGHLGWGHESHPGSLSQTCTWRITRKKGLRPEDLE